MTYLVFVIIGIAIGICFCVVRDALIDSGTIHIDLTDSRKDICNIELSKDLDEIITKKRIIFNVDAKWENDFFGGKK